MSQPNRKAAIPAVLSETAQRLTSEMIPFRAEAPDFFEQSFYCAGTSPNNNQCRALAAAKTKYTRPNLSGALSIVSGNFHLATGATHIAKCSYDVMAQLHELEVTYQDTLVKIDNFYILTMPSSTVGGNLVAAKTNQENAVIVPQALHNTQYTGHHKSTMQRVTQTAAAILELLDRFKNDFEAQKLFRIRYAGKIYTWGEFFFSANTDAGELYTAMQRSLEQDSPRPMVLYGKVGRSPQYNSKGGYSIWIPNGVRATLPGTKEIISLYIHTKDQDAADLMKGQKILAIGHWNLSGKYISITASSDTFIAYE